MLVSGIAHHQDAGLAPLVARAFDRGPGAESPRHCHPTAQLLYAVKGVMLVETDAGQWIVPPTRGIWVPIGVWHRTVMLGEVLMRTVYIRHEKLAGLPTECCVVGVSPLLRELILAAIVLPLDYDEQGRDGHLVQLLLDEIQRMPSLALAVPEPSSANLQRLCRALREQPDEGRPLVAWAAELAMDVRTLQRRFMRETGMTVGQWRRQCCLLLACERLARGESVLEVALALGYASPSAFSAMFKRELGVAPSLFYR
jgi:AraC-like DNA-binding protein